MRMRTVICHPAAAATTVVPSGTFAVRPITAPATTQRVENPIWAQASALPPASADPVDAAGQSCWSPGPEVRSTVLNVEVPCFSENRRHRGGVLPGWSPWRLRNFSRLRAR